jgi:hypothetical protein
VNDGELDPNRLARWRALEAEAEAAAIRADPVAARRRDRQFGRMVKDAVRDKRR